MPAKNRGWYKFDTHTSPKGHHNDTQIYLSLNKTKTEEKKTNKRNEKKENKINKWYRVVTPTALPFTFQRKVNYHLLSFSFAVLSIKRERPPWHKFNSLLQMLTKLSRFVHHTSGSTRWSIINRTASARVIVEWPKSRDICIFRSCWAFSLVVRLGIAANCRWRCHRNGYRKHWRFDWFHPNRSGEANNLLVPASGRPFKVEPDIEYYVLSTQLGTRRWPNHKATNKNTYTYVN